MNPETTVSLQDIRQVSLKVKKRKGAHESPEEKNNI